MTREKLTWWANTGAVFFTSVGALAMVDGLGQAPASYEFLENALVFVLPAAADGGKMVFPTIRFAPLLIAPLFLFRLFIGKDKQRLDTFLRIASYLALGFILPCLVRAAAMTLGEGRTLNLAGLSAAISLPLILAVYRGALTLVEFDFWFKRGLTELPSVCLGCSLFMASLWDPPRFFSSWLGTNLDLMMLSALTFLPLAGIGKLRE